MPNKRVQKKESSKKPNLTFCQFLGNRTIRNRYSDVVLRGLKWRPRETSAVPQAIISQVMRFASHSTRWHAR